MKGETVSDTFTERGPILGSRNDLPPEWAVYLARWDAEVVKHQGPGFHQNGTPQTVHAHGALVGSGTKEDPYKARSIVEAAQLIGAGHYVELKHERQLSTLVEEVHREVIAREAQLGKGKVPPVDLCKVEVPGTNLFCAQNVGVPRAQMPQLKGKPIPGSPADALPRNQWGEVDIGPAFIEHLKSQGVRVTPDYNVDAAFLKASQTELDGKKVGEITHYMRAGKVPPESIFVTSDDYVLDGHHRWAADITLEYGKAPGQSVIIPVNIIDAPITSMIEEAKQFAQRMGIPQAGLGKFSKAAEPCGCGGGGIIKQLVEGWNPMPEQPLWVDQAEMLIEVVAKSLTEAPPFTNADAAVDWLAGHDVVTADGPLGALMSKKEFTQERRDKLAEEGKAMPSGGYPIENVADLRRAIQAFGRAKNPAATKAWIIKRARALGRVDLLPDNWDVADIAKAAPAYERRFSYSRRLLPIAPPNTEWDRAAADLRMRKWASTDGSGDPDKVNRTKIAKGYLFGDLLPIGDIVGGRLVAVPRAIHATMAVLHGAPGGIDVPQDVLAKAATTLDRYDSALRRSAQAVTKAATEEDRFTLGPLYVPGRLDAHLEWTDSDNLQKGSWDYVRKADRRIRLQHEPDIVAGEMVEIVSWPWDIEVPMMKADGTVQPEAFPPGTVFMGVVWKDWAWPLVKAGKIRGYSMGGRAGRIQVDLGDVSAVEKFNANHETSTGRFAPGGPHGGVHGGPVKHARGPIEALNSYMDQPAGYRGKHGAPPAASREAAAAISKVKTLLAEVPNGDKLAGAIGDLINGLVQEVTA